MLFFTKSDFTWRFNTNGGNLKVGDFISTSIGWPERFGSVTTAGSVSIFLLEMPLSDSDCWAELPPLERMFIGALESLAATSAELNRCEANKSTSDMVNNDDKDGTGRGSVS